MMNAVIIDLRVIAPAMCFNNTRLLFSC